MVESSESLAAVVVTYRVLGLYKEHARVCMMELMRRKDEDQDPFDFEKFIDEKSKDIVVESEKYKINKELNSLLSAVSSIGKVL
jgi:hypothetical protein